MTKRAPWQMSWKNWDRRLNAIETKGENASASENEFAFKDESPYDDPDVIDAVRPMPADNNN